MAQGGRVGFANGSPNPMESDGNFRTSFRFYQSHRMLEDQFLYDTSPVGKLDKNILVKMVIEI